MLRGNEHFVHWDWINDGKVLDPTRPESLVYKVEPDGRRILEAAMFILPAGYTLSTTPDVRGRSRSSTSIRCCASTGPRFRGFIVLPAPTGRVRRRS
jgi:hypothetical protein